MQRIIPEEHIICQTTFTRVAVSYNDHWAKICSSILISVFIRESINYIFIFIFLLKRFSGSDEEWDNNGTCALPLVAF